MDRLGPVSNRTWRPEPCGPRGTSWSEIRYAYVVRSDRPGRHVRIADAAQVPRVHPDGDRHPGDWRRHEHHRVPDPQQPGVQTAPGQRPGLAGPVRSARPAVQIRGVRVPGLRLLRDAQHRPRLLDGDRADARRAGRRHVAGRSRPVRHVQLSRGARRGPGARQAPRPGPRRRAGCGAGRRPRVLAVAQPVRRRSRHRRTNGPHQRPALHDRGRRAGIVRGPDGPGGAGVDTHHETTVRLSRQRPADPLHGQSGRVLRAHEAGAEPRRGRGWPEAGGVGAPAAWARRGVGAGMAGGDPGGTVSPD